MQLTRFLAAAFPHIAALHLDALEVDDQQITLVLSSRRSTAQCPDCRSRSHWAHSRYTRTVSDIPVASHAVRLRITARRFYCRNAACRRQTFRERLPTAAPIYQRRTPLLRRELERVGFALGGQAGQRLLQQLGLSHQGVSRNSVLRVVRQAMLPTLPTPQVLGVDDWSFRRGQTYGTILSDLERHQVVDLLPDRSAQTLADWLALHPGVAVVSRDRAGAYAEGVRRGAPHAVQVADRFHMVKNATDVLEQVLIRQHRFLRLAARDQIPPANEYDIGSTRLAGSTCLSASLPPPKTRVQREQQARSGRQRARYEQVQALQTQGYSYRAIAKRVGLSRETVTRLARADAPPGRRHQIRRPSIMDPFEPYLRERWAQGEHNSAELYTEIREQGFTGSLVLVRQRLARWRVRPRQTHDAVDGSASDGGSKRLFSPRETLWLLMADPTTTQQSEKAAQQGAYVARLRELSPTIQQTQDLVVQFRQLLRTRDLTGFRAWLPQARRSLVPEVRGFARGLHRDRLAVEAAFVYAWNNGQVEGHVNRLKMLKRQMFGRASFALLRRRVLYHAA
ncbi:MAG TPA: ISL3 family transposase [Ktedonobacterales bacterium]